VKASRFDSDGKPDVSNIGAAGEVVRAFQLPSTVQHAGVPSQSWHASYLQHGDGKCDGFVTSAQSALSNTDADADADAAAAGIGYWSEDDLPFYYGLARTFPLADHWFSSCLGPTFPNRRFLIAGTAHGLIDDSPYDLLDYPPAGTIFDLLTEHGISWANSPRRRDHPVTCSAPKPPTRAGSTGALMTSSRSPGRGISMSAVSGCPCPSGTGQMMPCALELTLTGSSSTYPTRKPGNCPAVTSWTSQACTASTHG
jgi:hypothetical protein